MQPPFGFGSGEGMPDTALHAKRSQCVLAGIAAFSLSIDLCQMGDLALAQQQGEPIDVLNVAALPVEIRENFEAIAKTCKSRTDALSNFARYVASGDYGFIAIHFEKLRCDDPKDICQTNGCLHQIYVAKSNEPYQLLASEYVTEMELKYLDGTVAVEITSSTEGVRVRRWDGGGFN